MASAGLNNMRAFGFALIDLSSEEVLNSSITAVHAARCPPAEPPAAAIRLGSMPKSSAWERTPSHSRFCIFDAVINFNRVS